MKDFFEVWEMDRKLNKILNWAKDNYKWNLLAFSLVVSIGFASLIIKKIYKGKDEVELMDELSKIFVYIAAFVAFVVVIVLFGFSGWI